MIQALQFIMNLVISFFTFLNGITFEYEGFTIYYGWFFVALSIFGMVISVFWKGARS